MQPDARRSLALGRTIYGTRQAIGEIGEATSSARDLTEKGLAPLIEVTRILRPDIVVVSCMETQPRQLTKLADWLRYELADVGCEVRAIVPDERFNEASDLLPVL
jgi:hypothetical protein